MEYYRRDELYHHGIKGQKWGVRRYQNPDGTWTPAGKKRYSVISEAANTASTYAKYARNDRKMYNDQLSGKAKRTGVTTDSDLRRWIKVTEAQEKKYNELAKKYKNMKVEDIDRKTLKEAKKVANDFFTEADMSDYFQNGRWHNYQLPKNTLSDGSDDYSNKRPKNALY